jgi:hypothetical protein
MGFWTAEPEQAIPIGSRDCHPGVLGSMQENGPVSKSLHGAGRQPSNGRGHWSTSALAVSDLETLTRTCANSESDISACSSPLDEPFDEAISAG